MESRFRPAFGALVAAGLPLLLALTAIAATLGLLGPVSQLMALDPSTSSVVLLIGLAVGVDYCMFYLRREMEERDAGLDHQAALNPAAATSGRAVLISGTTVMVAMGGMLFAGNASFTSLAISAMLVVAVAVIGSLTVLPAVLSWLGEKGWTEVVRHETKITRICVICAICAITGACHAMSRSHTPTTWAGFTPAVTPIRRWSDACSATCWYANHATRRLPS